MSDPLLELQGAIVARLKSDAAVAALIGGRVFDTVPEGAEFPYVSLGPSDLTSANAECIEGAEFTLQIDAWSRAVGFPEVRNLANAARRALADDSLTIADNALVVFEHRQTRVFRDPDGLTSHAVIQFTGYVETP